MTMGEDWIMIGASLTTRFASPERSSFEEINWHTAILTRLEHL